MLENRLQVVHVAVGVVVQHEQVLICWRDAALHQGNRYEFPGGKVEAGETPEQALARELREELNIQVQHSIRAQQLHFNYPEKTVCLHVFLVPRFTGTPQGQQGQVLHWVAKNQLVNYHFPEANTPILRMVKLPEQYVITYPLAAGQDRQEWLNWHIAQTPQASWLYLREKTATAEQYHQLVEDLNASRPDLKIMADFNQLESLVPVLPKIHGVHINQSTLMQCQQIAIPEQLFCFAACHDQLSVQKANQLKVDAVVLSPLHVTTSHQGQAALGWPAWQQLCQQSQVPVYALGGVNPQDITAIQQAGGFGVAGIRAFFPMQPGQ
ncbi:Nudix family hydrolase [Alkanindiges sp. WGS2144]|uniref:Nudix family hydrolase n=1 Tax=Alkanindiges sp. WGS2144 TaxID=3366808 RepID=UPI003753ACF8